MWRSPVRCPRRNQARTHRAAGGRCFMTAVYTGMRASELRGLTWADVDFDKKLIHIRQRANYWGDIGNPKSLAGQRTVLMPVWVANSLREWKLRCPKGPLNLVFPNGAGNVEYHANICDRGFADIQRNFGLTVESGKRHKYNVHALRHFCASYWNRTRFRTKEDSRVAGTFIDHPYFRCVWTFVFDTSEDDSRVGYSKFRIT